MKEAESMTKLIVVRHGQSVSNLKKRFTGQFETPLTELGHAQAEATARYLDEYRIDRIYASDLSRAMDTARHTAVRQGLEVISERGFREIDAGLWETREYEFLRNNYHESYSKWINDIGRAHPDGGESVLALSERVLAALDRVVSENRGKTVAVFTHATPVRMMGCKWFGLDSTDATRVPFCANASVSIVEYEDDGSFRLIQYGYDKHQGEHKTKLPKGLV